MRSLRTPGWPTGGSLLTSGEGWGPALPSRGTLLKWEQTAHTPASCRPQGLPRRAGGQDEHLGGEEPRVQPPAGVTVLSCGPASTGTAHTQHLSGRWVRLEGRSAWRPSVWHTLAWWFCSLAVVVTVTVEVSEQ